MTAKTLRLILGDQLDANHSWFKQKDPNIVYLIAELPQETAYVKHHIQKLLAFFSAMQEFAKALDQAGHTVLHLSLDDTREHASLPALIEHVCDEYEIARFEYQRPDEHRLAVQLAELDLSDRVIDRVESEHFILPYDEISDFFSANKGARMETFYRKMRTRTGVLMNGNKPVGDQWNYDADNRKKLKKSDLDDIPTPLVFENPIDEILQRINRHQVDHFGDVGDTLLWPNSRRQARELLEFFCQHCLPRFGQFQDAMTANSDHAWSLYHSRLSFAINAKIISPMVVIERAVAEYEARPDEINLAQIEGFVRQILGWREFIRGIYWANMPDYANTNALQAKAELPSYFWTGQTKMRCMQASLGQSLDYAYAHHIQRLMVIGNFCLLAGIEPSQVDEWYLGVYIDAIEWVEMPNTRGMCQFADGGLVASKPYTASGAYINRMSDYCSSCSYKVKEKTSEDACPFNAMYWHFMDRHRDRFGNNPRIGMVYRNLDKMDASVKAATLERADWLLANLNDL